MGEEYYKNKYKVAKKEIKSLRSKMDDEEKVSRMKIDQLEKERDDLAEKIDQHFPRPQNQAVYDFFEQVTLWHSKRNLDMPSTTLPLTVTELRECGRNTASDTARQIVKKVFGSEKMQEAGCVSKLDQAIVNEILKYTVAKFKLRLSTEKKNIRKGITDACQYERSKQKQMKTARTTTDSISGIQQSSISIEKTQNELWTTTEQTNNVTDFTTDTYLTRQETADQFIEQQLTLPTIVELNLTTLSQRSDSF